MELCFCKHQSLLHSWVLLLKHMSYIVYPLAQYASTRLNTNGIVIVTLSIYVLFVFPKFEDLYSLNILQSCFPDVYETSFLKAFNKIFILSLCMATN